jgi:hypothetical protein
MLQTQLDDFLDFLDLLVQATNHVVCAVGHLLDHHEGDEGIDGRGKQLLELVRVAEQGDALAGGEFADIDAVGDIDDWLG